MKRERYIDLTKGLGILCIVFLHFEEGLLHGGVNVFIGSFMITLFYVTAGWIDAQRTRPMTIKELILRRWHQLGIPYLWWTAIILAFDCILWATGYYDTYYIGREIYKTLTLRGIGTLWFLPALFGGEVIWQCVKRNKWYIICALALTTIYQACYHGYFDGRTDNLSRILDAPFHTISNMLTAWVGLCAGYYFYKLMSHINYNGWSKTATIAVGLILGATAYICANYWPVSWLWGYFAPLIGPLAFILIFKAIADSRLTDYLDYWGRNSLCLMVTHYSIIMVLCDIANRAIFGQQSFYGWNAILWFIVCMCIEYPVTLFINKYMPYTLGRKRQATTAVSNQ